MPPNTEVPESIIVNATHYYGITNIQKKLEYPKPLLKITSTETEQRVIIPLKSAESPLNIGNYPHYTPTETLYTTTIAPRPKGVTLFSAVCTFRG